MVHELPALQPSKYDRLFKDLVSAEWCVKSDGNVEAPTGYFSITEIPEHPGELADMKSAVEQDQDSYEEWPEPGWYFTTENSDGMIRVYATDKGAAEILYQSYLKQYAEWDDESQWV